jgi:GR25 family glycosyltransferase involved in LPS biosynthesis
MKIKYYLIHCIEHNERKKHIHENILNKLSKLGQSIEIYKGIYTKHILLKNQVEYVKSFDEKLNIDNDFEFYLAGQIGCFLSHFKIIEKIMHEKKKHCDNNEYSVIFEDDVIFEINIHDKIIKIIYDLDIIANQDFDILFLGNITGNHGRKLINDIYFMDPNANCWGTHALLIKNKNIEKIYNNLCNIFCEIDRHYAHCIVNTKLKGLFLYPCVCFQNQLLHSNIII